MAKSFVASSPVTLHENSVSRHRVDRPLGLPSLVFQWNVLLDLGHKKVLLLKVAEHASGRRFPNPELRRHLSDRAWYAAIVRAVVSAHHLNEGCSGHWVESRIRRFFHNPVVEANVAIFTRAPGSVAPPHGCTAT